MKPDISVVIPTFRRPATLVEAIGSVIRQAGVSAEVIVVDDCPEGSAREAVAGFGDAVRYLRMTVPSGGRPALVRNRGWPLARAELVHFLDDDDLVPEGHHAAALAAFAAAPSVGVVFGVVAPFAAAGADLSDETLYFARAAQRARLCSRLGPMLGFAAALFFRPTLLVCGAAIVRRACLPSLGGFDAALPIVEDVDFYARAIRRYGACFMETPALHYRIGPSLMHRPGQAAAISEAYRSMQARYRAEHGRVDYLALKSLSRLIMG